MWGIVDDLRCLLLLGAVCVLVVIGGVRDSIVLVGIGGVIAILHVGFTIMNCLNRIADAFKKD